MVRGGGRQKQALKLQPIQDERSRRLTFARRNKGLKKKFQEFTTLCDVEACFISLGSEGQVETWPEQESRVHEIINRYRSVPKANKEKHMVVGLSTSTQEASSSDKTKNELKEVVQLPDVNFDKQEISNCHRHEQSLLEELSNIELAELAESLENRMQKIQERINSIIKSKKQQQQPLPFLCLSKKKKPVDQTLLLHNFLEANPTLLGLGQRNNDKAEPDISPSDDIDSQTSGFRPQMFNNFL